MSRTPPVLVAGAAVAAAALAAGVVGAAAATRALFPGQAIQISGSDIVCAYGGLAHHYGIGCALNSVRTAWTFRLEENALDAIHVVNAAPQPARPFREPHTHVEPGSSDVTSATIVGHVAPGKAFTARGTDLVCHASRMGGAPAVTCAKERSGRAIVGSYAGALTKTKLRVLRVTAHGAWTVVLTRPSTG